MINRKTKIYIYGDLRIRAFRVAWICEELQLEWEMEKTFPWSDKMYEINPLGKVPVIREDDFYLYESGAILNYLADKYQEKTSAPLLPEAGTRERAIVSPSQSSYPSATIAPCINNNTISTFEIAFRSSNRRFRSFS